MLLPLVFTPNIPQLSAVLNTAGPHTQALQAFASLQNGTGAAAAAELHRARAADGLMILGSAIVNAGALLRLI